MSIKEHLPNIVYSLLFIIIFFGLFYLFVVPSDKLEIKKCGPKPELSYGVCVSCKWENGKYVWEKFPCD